MSSTTGLDGKKPLVVSVLAANGQQSSAIVSHLLRQGERFASRFRLRAIVRNPSKYKSPETKSSDHGTFSATPSQVHEVVAGDMNDVESLKKAFHGTDVVWAMTNSDPAGGTEAELQVGKNIVDAFLQAIEPHGDAKAQRGVSGKKLLPLLVLSSHVDAQALTGGKIKMINATGKALIESYVHSLPLGLQEAFRFTTVHAGMFLQNFTTYQQPKVDDKGIYHFRSPVRPDVQIPFVDIADLGPLFWHLLETAFPKVGGSDGYQKYDRATIRLFGELLSYPQLVLQFTQATGRAAVFDYISLHEFLADETTSAESSSKLIIAPGIPALHLLSPAERYLINMARYFVNGSGPTPYAGSELPSDYNEVMVQPWMTPDAVIEMPYFPKAHRQAMGFKPLTIPEEDGLRLEGHADILQYFEGWRKTFWFEKGEIKSLAGLSSKVNTAMSDSTASQVVSAAVMEMRLSGRVSLMGDKPYTQDYVCMAYVNGEGKMVHYKEHWAVDRI